MKTVGISPKAVLAFLLPAAGTLILAILDQVLSPSIDPTLKVAIVGLVNATLAFTGAYAGNPGTVVDERSSWGNDEPAPAPTGGTRTVSVFTTPRVVGAYMTNPDPALGAPTDLSLEVPAGSVPVQEDRA